MPEYIWLRTVPRINGMKFAEGEGKPLYKNPCLMYMDKELNQIVEELDDETKATPGRYFVSDKNEVSDVRLYLAKCPDGTTQNVRQSRCEERPGQDLKTICTRPDPLTNKSQVDMIKEHLNKISQN